MIFHNDLAYSQKWKILQKKIVDKIGNRLKISENSTNHFRLQNYYIKNITFLTLRDHLGLSRDYLR